MTAQDLDAGAVLVIMLLVAFAIGYGVGAISILTKKEIIKNQNARINALNTEIKLLYEIIKKNGT